MMESHFENLSIELLLKIFECCSIRDLYQLQNTCTKFCKIIKSATSLGNAVPLLVTNHMQQEMRNKCTKLLTIKEKCYISYNWKNGIYKEWFIRDKTKYIPCLVLTKDYLWISKGGDIHTYKRHNSKLNYCKEKTYSVPLPSVDICKFVYKQNCLVSGLRNGDIFIWALKDNNIHLKNSHQQDIHSVDLDSDIIASGSRDESIKLWTFNNTHSSKLLHMFNMNDRVWSVAFNRGSQFLAAGTAGLNRVAPLHVIDTNSCMILQQLGQSLCRGSGILHMKWENPHILLSCGYDKNLRKWDTRVGACVQSWEDPYYSTVYCFDTDNYCTILAGTERHGRAVLWDTRVKKHIQVYFMGSCKRKSSPIYSISFDASTLFTATDLSLCIMDFSSKNGIKRDYSH